MLQHRAESEIHVRDHPLYIGYASAGFESASIDGSVDTFVMHNRSRLLIVRE
jgi:hypothetical protein